MIAVLCNSAGEKMLGTSGIIRVDARKTVENRLQQVREYKERFRKNFPHFCEYWTHCFFAKDCRWTSTGTIHPLCQ
jgi:hypothetical protein